MKSTKETMFGAAILAMLATGPSSLFAQTDPNFNGVSATLEGAIRLSWNSATNEVYEIDCADELVDPNTGTTPWRPLYTYYPSHGTNTFCLDTGDYFAAPPIPHPSRVPARFYRISLLGVNTAPAPSVSITSPTSGSTVSGDLSVTISASSDSPILTTSLYVDGQEMPPSGDGATSVINSCEWPNGPHTLFAVAKSQSKFAGTPNDPNPPTRGSAVSSYVNVTFDNLITRYSWSEWYFEPLLGQTQQVTAAFAANVNWTLQIQDTSSNTVRAATGSGTSMHYNWDGNGEGGANLPDGIYTYLLSASTNGQSSSQSSSAGEGDSSPPPLPALAGSTVSPPDSASAWYPTSAREAIAAGLPSYYLRPPPMPPVRVYTNAAWSFIPWEDLRGPAPLIEVPVPAALWQKLSQPGNAGDLTASGALGPLALDANTPVTQSTTGPGRPSNIAGKGRVGTCGVGYQVYTAPGTTYTTPRMQNIPGVPGSYIALDGLPGGSTETWGDITENTELAGNFIKAMIAGHYKPTVVKVNDSLTSSDLTGGAFNGANVALLSLHCSYATTAEWDDGVYYTYLRLRNGGNPSVVKLSSCDFGGAGTNGLKWMALLACNALRDQNYNSMKSQSRLPINNNLHLLLSTSTVATAAPKIGGLWATSMTLGTNGTALTVADAWYAAGGTAYTEETNHITINFRVAGWPDAFPEHITDTAADPGAGLSQSSDLIKRDGVVYNRP